FRFVLGAEGTHPKRHGVAEAGGGADAQDVLPERAVRSDRELDLEAFAGALERREAGRCDARFVKQDLFWILQVAPVNLNVYGSSASTSARQQVIDLVLDIGREGCGRTEE